MRSNDETIELIDKLRNKKGYSISELARRTGMAKSAISRYLNKTREFPLNRAEDFAKVLEVTPEFLLRISPDNSGVVKIPIIGTIACGDQIFAEENITGYIEVPEANVPKGEVFSLRAVGNSMTPTIPEGSNVIVRVQPNVEEGEVAAVLVNGNTEATLKRVRRQNGLIMLVADNNRYQPYIVTSENPATILGKAVSVNFEL